MSEMLENLVSVITPLYNAEKYITETIVSVQAQTYQMWEMIIVDDASTDQSAKIVKELMKKEARIQYYRNDVNSGVAQSRNKAINKARGRYIAFLDSDDLWEADKLEKQLLLMRETKSFFCYGACAVIDEKGKKIKKIRNVPDRIDYKELLKSNVIPCLTVVIDRKNVPDIILPQIPHEDYAAWLTILKKGIAAYGITEVIAYYRVGHKSISRRKWQALKWTWNIYRNYLNLDLHLCIYNFCCYAVKGINKYIS